MEVSREEEVNILFLVPPLNIAWSQGEKSKKGNLSHLDILPGVNHLIWRVSKQADVSPPRVEVGCIRLNILPTLSQPMRVEDKLVRREEDAAQKKFKLKRFWGKTCRRST